MTKIFFFENNSLKSNLCKDLYFSPSLHPITHASTDVQDPEIILKSGRSLVFYFPKFYHKFKIKRWRKERGISYLKDSIVMGRNYLRFQIPIY